MLHQFFPYGFNIQQQTTTILYSAEENFDKIIRQPAEIAKLVEAGCDIIYLDYIYFDSPLD